MSVLKSIKSIQDLRTLRNDALAAVGDEVDQSSIIIKPKAAMALTLKRMETADGLCKLQDDGKYKPGQTCIVILDSVRQMEVIDNFGNKHIKDVVNLVDATGKDLGFIWAELFYL